MIEKLSCKLRSCAPCCWECEERDYCQKIHQTETECPLGDFISDRLLTISNCLSYSADAPKRICPLSSDYNYDESAEEKLLIDTPSKKPHQSSKIEEKRQKTKSDLQRSIGAKVEIPTITEEERQELISNIQKSIEAALKERSNKE